MTQIYYFLFITFLSKINYSLTKNHNKKHQLKENGEIPSVVKYLGAKTSKSH